MKPTTVNCFGSLHIQIDGREKNNLATDRARALLAYLITFPHQPHRREKLASLLWPERSDSVARQNLRKTLSRLRKGFAPYEIVISDYKTVRLNQKNLQTDLWRCEALLDEGDLHQAVALYKGEFLQGFYLADNLPFDEWLLLAREMWHQRIVHALNRLVAQYEREQAHEQVIQFAQQAIALEFWHEQTHRRLMWALAQNGRLPAALAHYQQYTQQLEAELGVSPAPETEQLYHQLQQNVAPPTTQWHNFPTEMTRFVGRETEIAHIQQTLKAREVRLLTIIGAGGMGKTRLAIHATRQLTEDIFQGIYFVPLALLSQAEQILPLLIQLFEVPDVAALLAALNKKSILLVLDNFEHLYETGYAVVEKLLQTDVTILITSRRALNLSSEWRLSLRGLSNATELFASRAQRYGYHQFSPTDLDRIEQISRLVEGMPLAIEMAAAWLRAYDLPTLTEFLQESIDAWQAPHPDLPTRHRSMDAVFAGSWRLLSVDLQTLFGQLALFQGGFTAQAAHAVTGASFLDLARLLDRSLVRMEENGRYHIHELLRQFARLKSPITANDQQAHSRYFLALLAQQNMVLNSQQPRPALDVLRPESANLRLAWGFAVDSGQWSEVETAVVPLTTFYKLLGLYQEQEVALRYALEKLDAEQTSLKPQLLIHLADVLERLSQFPAVNTIAQELITQQGGVVIEIEGHFLGIRANMRMANYRTAQQHVHEAQLLIQSNQQPRLMVKWLMNAGRVANLQAKYAESKSYFLKLLHIAQLPRLQILAHINLATTTLHMGQYVQTRGHIQQTKQLIRQHTLGGLDLLQTVEGALSIHLGQPKLAIDLLQKGIMALQKIGERWSEAISCYTLSMALFQLGELTASQEQALRCYEIAQRVRDPHLQAFGMLAQGRVYQGQGKYVLAEQAYAKALVLRLPLEQPYFILNLRARLVEIYHLLGREQAKQEQLALLLEKLPTTDPHGSLEPFYPHWVCVQFSNSEAIATLARQGLMERAQQLDGAERQHYLYGHSFHAQLAPAIQQ